MTLLALAAYVGIVQDRPPILRAALMAALYLCARPLFRRVELLNTIADGRADFCLFGSLRRLAIPVFNFLSWLRG